MSKHRGQEPEECEAYLGNVCSGFGGSTICWSCHKEMFEHSAAALGYYLGKRRKNG